MIALRDFLTRHRMSSVITFSVVGVLLGVALMATISSRIGDSPPVAKRSAVAGRAGEAERGHEAQAVHPADQLSQADRDALKASIARLRSMPRTKPATSDAHPPIRGQATQQPDLFAAEFARRLLTQNYRASRAALLAWVQSESAHSSESTVFGLVPADVRDKLAVASVQEGFSGTGPVPSQGVWDALARLRGRTSVVIQRVIEPVAWSAAVANGTITGPGVTAREVDAEVTLHTKHGGQKHTEQYSTALTMNLEGPPVREGYGMVTVVRYKSVRVPTS